MELRLQFCFFDTYCCFVIPGLTRNPDSFQSAALLVAGSVTPDLIRDLHDGQKLDAFLNCDTASDGRSDGGRVWVGVSTLPLIPSGSAELVAGRQGRGIELFDNLKRPALL